MDGGFSFILVHCALNDDVAVKHRGYEHHEQAHSNEHSSVKLHGHILQCRNASEEDGGEAEDAAQ